MTAAEPLDLERIETRWSLGEGMTGRYSTATEEADYRDVHALLAEVKRYQEQEQRIRAIVVRERECAALPHPPDKLVMAPCVVIADDLERALDGAS